MKTNKEGSGKIDLGLGLVIEVIETIPDKDDNNLRGYLYYLGKPLEGIEEQPLFKTYKEIEEHFSFAVLPAYINSNGNFYSIRFFKEENSIREFVKAYLIKNKINWGQTLDIIEILESCNYYIPKSTDKGFNVDELNEYRSIVTDISREFVNHLKMFGFGADRNTSNLHNHPIKEKAAGCMNLVFTRYPWTSAYKIIKTVKSFLSISGRNFFAEQDIRKFENEDPESYEFVNVVVETLKDVHTECSAIDINTGFEKAAMDFIEHIDFNSDYLHDKYSKKRPAGYGKYK